MLLWKVTELNDYMKFNILLIFLLQEGMKTVH